MAVKGGQRFIARNRPPRVQIAYKDPHDEEKLVELPFKMGIMADLSGNDPGKEKLPMDERKFAKIDMDNFEGVMRDIQPGVSFRVKNRISDDEGTQVPVKLRFTKMSDFEPPAIAEQVPALKKLYEARKQLDNLRRYMDGRVDAEQKLKELLEDPQLMRALRERGGKQDDKNASDETAETADSPAE